MKHPQFFICLISLLLSGRTAQAQLVSPTVVKVNLSGAVFKNYQVQYERILTPRSTITVTAGASIDAPLPFKQALMDQYGENDDAVRAINRTLFNKYTGTLEYRFYFSGQAPRGWYIAPFVRYINMDISQDYTYTPSDGLLHHAHMNAKFNAFGAGILLGHQWLIGNRVTLDLWLLGPFYGTNVTADFVGEDPLWKNLKPADITKLHSDIENTTLPGYTTTATIAVPLIEAKLVGPYYGVRAFGVGLGYRF